GQGDGEGDAEAAAKIDLSALEVIGKCPKCGSSVYEYGMNYSCEKNIRKQGCDFRTGKIILQRPIEREQVIKLLTTGKTDLLHKFISKKNRPFSAFLVYNAAEKKVGFEFAPREPKAPKGAKPKAKPAPVEPKPA